MDQERIHSLLRKYGKQACTPEETAELERWYASLGGEKPPPFADAAAASAMQEQLWQQISAARQPARRFSLPVWARVAAVILPLAVAALLLFKKDKTLEHNTLAVNSQTHTVSSPYGATRKLVLPDGTEVWLNAGSELRYEPDFNNSRREVTLQGEAYFDVKANAEKPFIIRTGKMNIRVLGTSFNVKAYPEDQLSEASLIRGAIEVSPASQPDRRFILKPNDKIVLLNQQLKASPGIMPPEEFAALQQQGYTVSKISVDPADNLVAETAWLSNRLVFMNESFEDIALRLERKFEVKVIFEDSIAPALRFTATFDDEDVRQTLEALRYTAAFNFRIENKNIYITR